VTESGERVLLTGGTGYIGSHTAVALLVAGHDVVLLDNLANSRREVAGRIARIARRAPRFVQADIRDRQAVAALLRAERITSVIHFAGLKSVPDSVRQPLPYVDTNVAGSIALLLAMEASGVRSLVYSSSAAVYGPAAGAPALEGAVRDPASPYGLSKAMVEDILAATQQADPRWRIAVLRYFNPVGAHESGLIGEEPVGPSGNVMPVIVDVAAGRRPQLEIFGGDYPTADGTAIRDYIHVMDLAEAHVAAMGWRAGAGGFLVCNVGAGRGVSVLELVQAFEGATGVAVPCRIVGRRPGDGAECWADTGVGERQLGWRAMRDLAAMCRDAWRWELARHEVAKAAAGTGAGSSALRGLAGGSHRQ
jgi:UDP-glucose 4-epimerase